MKTLYVGLSPPESSSERCVVHYPVIRTVPVASEQIEGIAKLLPAFTHIIFTSKTAVQIMGAYVSQDMPQKVIAVGQATASAVRNLGASVHAVASEETAEGVVEVLRKEKLDHAHVFWPRSRLARTVISDYLRGQNVALTELVVYDTEHIQTLPKPDLTEFDEVIFTSPSTIDGFLAIFGSIPAYLKITCQGPVTYAHLQRHQSSTHNSRKKGSLGF